MCLPSGRSAWHLLSVCAVPGTFPYCGFQCCSRVVQAQNDSLSITRGKSPAFVCSPGSDTGMCLPLPTFLKLTEILPLRNHLYIFSGLFRYTLCPHRFSGFLLPSDLCIFLSFSYQQDPLSPIHLFQKFSSKLLFSGPRKSVWGSHTPPHHEPVGDPPAGGEPGGKPSHPQEPTNTWARREQPSPHPHPPP